MNLDLRIPMGLLFTLVGGIMSIYGFFTRGSAIYERSDAMNINLIWGLIMLVFGVTMYTLGRRSDKRPRAAQVEGTTRPMGHGHGGH
jgi:multisubunit Na+/H+ antiporter MnhG subunit